VAKSNASMALAFAQEEAERELVPLARPPRKAPRDAEGRPVPSRRRMPLEAERRTPLSFLLGTTMGRVLLGLFVLSMGGVLWAGWRTVHGFFLHDPHFLVTSADSIEVTGTEQLPREAMLAVFGGDLGRSIFSVPLRERQRELQEQPWVAQASVMRLLPNRLRVDVVERTPVAFARVGKTVELVDGEGTLLQLDPATLAARHYSFPVVTGLAPTDPPAARAVRMALYTKLVAELGEGGTALNSLLSEVDLTDAENVRVSVPAEGRDLRLDMGEGEFLARFESFRAHLPEWRQQYPELSEVDLRYDRQVVLKMADGAVEQRSSLPSGNALNAAPDPEAPPPPRHGSAPVRHAPAGHGTAHGWRPR
jgi:cell division protein FtsQ